MRSGYAATVITPISSHPTARLLLGHFAEGAGEHYVCPDEDSLLTERTGIESHQVQEKCIEEEQHNAEPTDPCQVDAPGIDGDTNFEEQSPVSPKYADDNLTDNETEENKNQEDGDDVKYMSLDLLPNEVLEMIITIAISSSGFSWPNHICRVYQRLNNVNARFRQCVKKLRPLLPRVHYPSGQPGIISVCKLIRQYGSGSGLLLEIKIIISHPRWNSVWLRLVMEGLGKFIIFNIFWRKGSK